MREVSFSVESGKFVAIMGASGSGKSTLLHVMAGLTSPTQGSVEIEGQKFVGLNGGPQFRFNEAGSLSVDCGSQEELDELWEKLSAGGSGGQCGWLKDRYGLSWQIVPSVLPKLLAGTDPARAQRVLAALMGMRKLDIRALEAAAGAQ